VQAEDILTLKRLQERVLKEALKTNDRKQLMLFCKNEVKSSHKY
jgi:hypothetical protein